MRTLFITATGTGLGKTFVTQALAAQLKRSGRTVRVLKPVVTGISPDTLADSDPALLLEALGEPLTEAALDRMSPFRYAAPLAPSLAAAKEGRSLSVESLIASCRTASLGPEDHVLIEGVGGVMVPLAGPQTVLDWIVALGAPALLVTGSYLGALSHTLTALAVLEAAGSAVAGVVVSESVELNIGLTDTVAALAPFTSAPILPLPRLTGPRAWERAPDLTSIL